MLVGAAPVVCEHRRQPHAASPNFQHLVVIAVAVVVTRTVRVRLRVVVRLGGLTIRITASDRGVRCVWRVVVGATPRRRATVDNGCRGHKHRAIDRHRHKRG